MSFVKINQFGIFWFSENNSDCYTVGQDRGGNPLQPLTIHRKGDAVFKRTDCAIVVTGS